MELTFTSLEFVLFLCACLGVLYATRTLSVRKWLSIIFSYLFCLSFGVAGVLVITATAVIDYIVGRRIGSATNDTGRKQWLWVGIGANVAPLLFFKYAGFLAEIIAALLHPLRIRVPAPHGLVLPVIGISYFAFAGISYVFDVYYQTMEPAASLSDYVLYLTYFPKIIAGPIVRAADFLPQLRNGFKITAQDFEIGCAYFVIGAVKKLVIADQLAPHVSIILAAPQQYNAFTLLQGMLGYTVQIYADFSGYSDMAIGCARLMGITFPQNFLMPYSSLNIAEFWRRWHVTLSNWLRDYIFLPLEFESRGTHNPNVRASRNILITMVVCGFWHGASWNFVLWGALHGVALAVYQLYTNLRPRTNSRQVRSSFHPGALVARLLTLCVVMVGWIIFGTHTLTIAFRYLWRMISWRTDGLSLGSPYIVPLAGLMLLAHLCIHKDRNLAEELPAYSVPVRALTYACLLLALVCLVPTDTVPFAYLGF